MKKGVGFLGGGGHVLYCLLVKNTNKGGIYRDAVLKYSTKYDNNYSTKLPVYYAK